ncbi:MAG: hypothetical protein IJ206_13100 [Oscillospiraceae bacterium]|nr:hypothetical protein [Oscillospiraceae bacterium]
MATEPYATLADVKSLWRADLSLAEQARVQALLGPVSDCLRQAAKNVGEDLDALIESGDILPSVATTVTVDVIARVIQQDASGAGVYSQASQSALGYTQQMTYAIPGGGIANAVMRNDLIRLGIGRQRIEAIELWQ